VTRSFKGSGSTLVFIVILFVFVIVAILMRIPDEKRNTRSSPASVEKYGPSLDAVRHRPFNLYLKEFASIDETSLHSARQAFSFIWPEVKDRFHALEAGRLLYSEHKDKFDLLSARYEELVIRELARPISAAEAASADSPRLLPDTELAKTLAQSLCLVAWTLAQDGDRSSALHLFVTVAAFGRLITSGDKSFPVSILSEAGCSMLNYSLSPLLHDIIVSDGQNAAGETAIDKARDTALEEFLKALEQIKKAAIPFTSTREADRQSLDTLVDSSEFISSLPPEATSFSGEQLKSARDMAHTAIADVFSKTTRLFIECSNEIALLESGTSALVWELIDKERVFSKSEKRTDALVASFLVSRYPNYFGAYVNRLKVSLRIDGTILLAKIWLLKKGALPASGDEIIKMTGEELPIDLFKRARGGPGSSAGLKCACRILNKRLVLYSCGSNGIDDGGDGEKDFMLFALPGIKE
jgi:hypothetical protein